MKAEAENNRGPLAGIRILDFTQAIAGPFATLQLADLGAEVLKVEPPDGDYMRSLYPGPAPGETKFFHALNRGKQSIVIDLNHPGGRMVIQRLVPTCDAVVVTFRPGTAAKLGIDYQTLKSLNPGLIYVESTAFGTRGPLAHEGGRDVTVQAYSGFLM